MADSDNSLSGLSQAERGKKITFISVVLNLLRVYQLINKIKHTQKTFSWEGIPCP